MKTILHPSRPEWNGWLLFYKRWFERHFLGPKIIPIWLKFHRSSLRRVDNQAMGWHRKGDTPYLNQWSLLRWRICVRLLSVQWRRNERDWVSNHQPHDCLLSRLFRRRWKKKSNPRVTGLCAGNSPVTGEFPTQRASINAENVSIWLCHHVYTGRHVFTRPGIILCMRPGNERLHYNVSYNSWH